MKRKCTHQQTWKQTPPCRRPLQTKKCWLKLPFPYWFLFPGTFGYIRLLHLPDLVKFSRGGCRSIWITSRDIPLSASPGVCLTTWFLMSSSDTPTPVSNWDITHSIKTKNEDNISLTLHSLFFSKSNYITHLHAKYTYFLPKSYGVFFYQSHEFVPNLYICTLQNKRICLQHCFFDRLTNKRIFYLHYTRLKNHIWFFA